MREKDRIVPAFADERYHDLQDGHPCQTCHLVSHGAAVAADQGAACEGALLRATGVAQYAAASTDQSPARASADVLDVRGDAVRQSLSRWLTTTDVVRLRTPSGPAARAWVRAGLQLAEASWR